MLRPRAGSAYRDRLRLTERDRGPARLAFSLGSSPSRSRDPQGRCALRPCGLRAPALSGRRREAQRPAMESARSRSPLSQGPSGAAGSSTSFGCHDRSRPTNFGSPCRLSASAVRYSSHEGVLCVRLAAASRVTASISAWLASNRSVRKSSGDWTLTPSAASPAKSKSFKLFVTSTPGRDRRRSGGDVPVLRVRNSDHALCFEAGNECIRKPRPHQGNGAGRDTLARLGLHRTEPFLFDAFAPSCIERVVLRQLQQQVAQVVRIQDVGVKKRFYRAGHSSLQDLPCRPTWPPQRTSACPRTA